MTWFDYAVLTIMAISVLIGIVRGFVRELIALMSWVVAFIVAQHFTSAVAPWLDRFITSPWLRTVIAFIGLLLASLLVMSLIAFLLSRIVKSSGLGLTDRILGAVFGVARGLAMVLIAVLIAGLTPVPREPGWRDAMFSPPLVALAQTVKLWLPAGLAKQITYR
jgi:membrane protein required for colicin V production